MTQLIIRFSVLILAVSSCLGGSLPFSRFGLIDIPSTDVLQHTQIAIGGSFTTFSYETADSTTESDFAMAGHLDVGLFDRGQIGITWLGDGGISGNASIRILSEALKIPAVVIGCQNIIGEEDYEFFSSNDTLYHYEESQNFSAYVVIAKNLDYISGVPVCVTLGYGIGRFRQGANSESDGISNPLPGLFGALEFHPANNLSITLEWDGRDANIGAGYSLNRNVRFLGAICEYEQLTRGEERDMSDVMQNMKISLGVEFTLGPFLNRTTLEPFEKLTEDYDAELLLQLEEMRSRAREEIEELKRDIP